MSLPLANDDCGNTPFAHPVLKEATPLKKKTQSGKTDMVFVLRFWREAGWGIRPAAWHAEIKELGPTRELDQRFWAEGPAATFKLIVKRLQRSLKREA